MRTETDPSNKQTCDCLTMEGMWRLTASKTRYLRVFVYVFICVGDVTKLLFSTIHPVITICHNARVIDKYTDLLPSNSF